MKTDLSYLVDMTEGNKGLISEMIEIFSTQVNQYRSLMLQFYIEENWEEISQLAHKAKSSVAIMGMKDLAQNLKELELLARDGKDTESYPVMIDYFRNECKIAIAELQDYVSNR
jgi:HPt (histidine-containing phosphotransfer) domain-containing protein